MPKYKKKDFDVGRTLNVKKSDHLAPPKDIRTSVDETALEPEKRPKWRRILVWSFLTLFILIFIAAAWEAVSLSSASKKAFGSSNIFSYFDIAPLQTDANGRVNILLVGYSVDDPGHQGANLTDSIMLLSMNQTKHTAYMLSIPRDLYVKLGDNGYGKINEAYNDGGMPLLQQIVQDDFGVQIGYYGLINYSAVRDMVNAVGGIDVTIKSSDPRGLYDPNISPVDGGPLKLANGIQHLGGQTALNLTRARGDAYGSYGFAQADFDRTEHQRQVLTAIKQKLTWKIVLNPHTNWQIFSAFGNNVKSNLTPAEARGVFSLMRKTPDSAMASYSLRSLKGTNYLTDYYSPTSGATLIPINGASDFSDIQAAVDQLKSD
jgi:LCP family protein required for cell wall assembly